MDHLNELVAIMRNHAHRRTYNGHHVRVRPEGWADLQHFAQHAASPHAPQYLIDQSAWLLGLPVTVDTNLRGAGRWQIVRGDDVVVIDSNTFDNPISAPTRCYCGGPEETAYGHPRGQGPYCRNRQ